MFTWTEYVDLYARDLFSAIIYYMNRIVYYLTLTPANIMNEVYGDVLPDWLDTLIVNLVFPISALFPNMSVLSILLAEGLIIVIIASFVKWIIGIVM